MDYDQIHNFWEPKVNDLVTFKFSLNSNHDEKDVPVYKIVGYNKNDLNKVTICRQKVNKQWQTITDVFNDICVNNNTNLSDLGFKPTRLFNTVIGRFSNGEFLNNIPIEILIPTSSTATAVTKRFDEYSKIKDA